MNPGSEAPSSNKRPPVHAALQWHERLNVLNVTLTLFLLAAIVSTPVLKGSGRDIDYLERLISIFRRMFPPDLSVTGDAFFALLETIRISIWATLFSVLLAFPIAIAGASTLSPAWLAAIVRFTMIVVRTVPSLIWALIAVSVVGPNPLAGVIGLTFYSLGYLVKFFCDAFESVDMKVADGLKGMGANSVQAFQHGLWPQAKPLIWSYSLFMFEYNIRNASIIGFVGAGGIGVLLHSYSEFGDWDKFCTVLLLLLIPVTILDLIGNWARKRITRRATAT
jgi:phosphonate transport system permease protein